MNRMLCDNIIIKTKTLPLYEHNGIYNLKKRKFKQMKNLHEFNMNTAVLTDKIKAGNLWTGIKKFFKKGKKFVKDAVNYIDNSPILSTVKDIAADYVQEKTGINPNDYYDMAKNVVNSSSKELKDAVSNATVKTLKNAAEKRKENKKTGKKSNTREEIKNIMTDYKNNLIKEIPDQKQRITTNFDLFSSGIAEGGGAPLSALKPTLWKKWGPMFLMADKSTGKCGSIASDLLKTKYGLKRLTLPKTLKDILEKGKGENTSNGRLYMGRGEEEKTSSGKKRNEKYMKLLASLKK